MAEEQRTDIPPGEKVDPSKDWLKIVLFSVLGVITVGGLVFAGIQISKKQNQPVPQLALPTRALVTCPTPIPTITPELNANLKTYKNDFYHLELAYPQNYSLSENADKIEISSPLSKCNPKLLFNIEEYGSMHEVQIFLKKRPGSLEEVLKEEDGWSEIVFNGKKGYFIAVGAEMVTPLERYLVESGPDEVLEIQAYTFGTNDLGKCVPKLDAWNATKVKNQILSTFKFL